jgi:hypothetical protein
LISINCSGPDPHSLWQQSKLERSVDLSQLTIPSNFAAPSAGCPLDLAFPAGNIAAGSEPPPCVGSQTLNGGPLLPAASFKFLVGISRPLPISTPASFKFLVGISPQMLTGGPLRPAFVPAIASAATVHEIHIFIQT